MKFGIYLALAPDQPLINQGLSRLLSFLIKGAVVDGGHEVTIAAPHWSREGIYELLDDQRIPRESVQLLTTSADPIWLRIKHLLESKRKGGRLKRFVQTTARNTAKQLIAMTTWVFTSNSMLEFLIKSPLLVPMIVTMLVAALLALPLLLVMSLVALIAYLLNALKNSNILERVPSLGKLARVLAFLKRAAFHPARIFRQHATAHFVFNQLKQHETHKVIALINTRADIPVWFVPTMFWKEIIDIRAKKVVAAPDFVQVDFPIQFRSQWGRMPFDECAQTILHADALVCYGEHVRQKHLIQRFGISPYKIHVVHNGPVDLSGYLDECIAEGKAANRRESALYLLRAYQKKKLQKDTYLGDFDMTSCRFLFYSSQPRPHKNMHNLVLAYEQLLRREYINTKLVLTANLEHAPQLRELIVSRGLHRDVLCFYEVPSAVLAALNHLAELAVVPTLFEGGFPIFSFTEAYSVGTPCLMAKAPMVFERFPASPVRDVSLFDPYDYRDMAERIKWALENRSELVTMQADLYRSLTTNGWSHVAEQYIDVFKEVATSEVRPADHFSGPKANESPTLL